VRLQLDIGEIHAWYRATKPEDYDSYRTVLSVEELARCERFHFVGDRCDYANAHDLLRRMLSLYDTTPPKDWRFDAAPHGKPFLSSWSRGEGGGAPLAFNLSHTQELTACVVARGVAVGIDVERADRVHDALALATRFFSPLEVAGLQACRDGHDRARRFIELWTLKESFIKAIGKGLSQPLDSVTFDLSEEGAIGFIPPAACASETWNFSQYEVREGLLAIAVSAEHALRVIVREVDGDGTAIRASRTTHRDSQ
jgi:4'-phosphopantetheinyl transferase